MAEVSVVIGSWNGLRKIYSWRQNQCFRITLMTVPVSLCQTQVSTHCSLFWCTNCPHLQVAGRSRWASIPNKDLQVFQSFTFVCCSPCSVVPLPAQLLSQLHCSIVSRTEWTHINNWLLCKDLIVNVRRKLDLKIGKWTVTLSINLPKQMVVC